MANGNGFPAGKPPKKKAAKPKSWLQKTGGKVGEAISGFARKQAGAPAAKAPTKLKSMRDMAKDKNGNGNGN